MLPRLVPQRPRFHDLAVYPIGHLTWRRPARSLWVHNVPVCIEVVRQRVRSLDRDNLEISWEVKDTVEDTLDYTFQLLRSESPSGPFDPICEPFSDRFLFVDNRVPAGNRWRMLHYLVRVTHIPTGDSRDFGPVAHEPEPDLIALELRRHIQLLLHEFAGRRCWVLPVRTFGPRCECWDPRLFKRTRSRCLLCFDTGFQRGYLSPIEVWVQMDPSPKTRQVMSQGTVQQVNTTGRVGYYPPLKPDDLIIEPENRRWRITSVSQTEQGRAPVLQELQLHEIPPKDIVDEVPLHLDRALKDVVFNPPRNYSNPMTLESFENEELPHIFAMYQRARVRP